MVKLLLKNRIASLLASLAGRGKSGSSKKRSAASYVVMAVLYAVLILCFAFLSTTMAISLGAALIPLNASWLYFAIFMLASVSFLFIFSIFETKAELFECKDNDLILSMPIKPKDIVLSRISMVLIYNYLEQAVIMLPAIIVYLVFSHDLIGAIGASLISLFLPLFSTALASGVGYAVAWITKKIKNNSFIILFISLAFLLAYFFGYGKLMEGMEHVLEAEGESLLVSRENAPILYLIGSSAHFAPLGFLFVIATSVASALVAYLIITKNYIKIISGSKNGNKIAYKRDKSVQKSALYSLTLKEMRRFISSATYMLNGAIGYVFLLIAGIAALIKRNDILTAISALVADTPLSADDFLSPLLTCVIILILSMSMISASALSLEGKNLWIPKTLPISDKEVLLSKALPQIIISLPPTLICSVLFIIAAGTPIKYWAFVILTPILANVSFSFFGLIINILCPKFNYENEAQVVKQSLSVFLVMTIQALIGIALIILNFVLALMNLALLAMIITLLIFICLSVLFLCLLLGPCARKYSKIDV